MGEDSRTAAVVTIGSELTLGLRTDTNTRYIASLLSRDGYSVIEALTIADDRATLTSALKRLCDSYPLVITTGGLGPTHDDLTREAAAEALGLGLSADSSMHDWLKAVAARHSSPDASAQVYRQADRLDGARLIEPTTGTAPGQIVPTPLGTLLLLPGPPREMSPMLEGFLDDTDSPVSSTLRCVGISESDAQVTAEEVLAEHPAVSLTVLATPSLVDVVLVQQGEGTDLPDAAMDVAAALGSHVYASDGRTLAHVVLDEARILDTTIVTAESCTGGLLAAALTDVPGSSEVIQGGVVTYSNESKSSLLGVPEELLLAHGAVSAPVAEAMAAGAAQRLDGDLALAITGIAGPDGGTDEKPVGLVWFGISHNGETRSFSRNLLGDRTGIRTRAVVAALDGARVTLGG